MEVKDNSCREGIWNQSWYYFILKSLQPFRWFVLIRIAIGIFFAIDVSINPYLTKLILNKVQATTPEKAFGDLWKLAVLYLFLAAAVTTMFRFDDWIRLRMIPHLKKRIGTQLMDRMLNHAHGLYQDHFAGNLANKVNDVINGIPEILDKFIENFFGHLLALAIAVYTVGCINSKFSIALVMWVGSFLLVSIGSLPLSKQLSSKAAEKRSLVVGLIVDTLSNIMSVRLFCNKRREQNYLDTSMQSTLYAERKQMWFFLRVNSFQGFSYIAFQAVCLWWLIAGLQDKSTTTGDFALILTLNTSIVYILWGIAKDAQKLADNIGKVIQGLQVVKLPLEIRDHPQAKDLRVSLGEIIFDKVQFAYKGFAPLFTNLSIIIQPGQKVGLVGYSGGGKTTFISLLLRLFDIEKGRILIDGQDIQKVTQDTLRRSISLIPQELSLFHRSLMENIRYGRPEATDKEVIEASQKAKAHDFILSLPQGYQSLVGERGIKLSGGQRQRIAIARAILKNAPILLLDEATSQLDSFTESQIQESLWNLMQEKTALVIAHRLSTLLYMDRILVFDKGHLIEKGTHADLLSAGGQYKTLWDTQVGGFLPSAP